MESERVFFVAQIDPVSSWLGWVDWLFFRRKDAGTIFTSAFASAAEDATADFIVLLAADGGGTVDG